MVNLCFQTIHLYVLYIHKHTHTRVHKIYINVLSMLNILQLRYFRYTLQLVCVYAVVLINLFVTKKKKNDWKAYKYEKKNVNFVVLVYTYIHCIYVCHIFYTLLPVE